MTMFRKLLFALLALAPTQALAADSVYGVWLRDGHGEKLEFYDCAGKLCAKGMIPGADGTFPVILRSAAKIAPNQWKGNLFNPEDGKLYEGTITLDNANQLTLSGCLMTFLCKSETWTRVSKTPASAKSKT